MGIESSFWEKKTLDSKSHIFDILVCSITHHLYSDPPHGLAKTLQASLTLTATLHTTSTEAGLVVILVSESNSKRRQLCKLATKDSRRPLSVKERRKKKLPAAMQVTVCL